MSLLKVSDNYSASIVGNFSSSAAIITVDIAPVKTSGYLTVFDLNGNQFEKIKYTGVSGLNLTGCVRGLSFDNNSDTPVVGNAKDLKNGMSIKMTVTQHYINPLVDTLNGDLPLPAVLQNPTTRLISDPRDLTDKEYVDGIASAGIIAMLVTDNGGITININPGTYLLNGVVKVYPGVAAHSLTNNSDNYIQIKDGVLDVQTDAFDDDAIPLALATCVSGDITVLLDTRPFYTGVDVAPNMGLGRDANGIFIDLGTDSALEFTEDGLEVKVKNGGGLVKDSNGLKNGFSYTAGETISKGDLTKLMKDSGGVVKLFKKIGIGTQVSGTVSSGLYSSTYSFDSSIALTETKFIIIYSLYVSSSNWIRYALCLDLQTNGTYNIGSPVQVSAWNESSTVNDGVKFVKRINDTSFIVSEKFYSASNSQGTPSVKVCSVSGTTVTVGSGVSFGVGAGGNSSSPYCVDAVNLSSNNWVFYIAGTSATYSNYMKLFAGQIDSSTRTITYGSAGDVITSTFSASSFLIKNTNTSVIAFYGTAYREASINFSTNVFTFSYSAQTDPISTASGTRIKYIESLITNSTGVAFYRNSSTYATIAFYSISSGVITLSQTTVLTSVTSSSESAYRYDSDLELFLFNYTVGGVAKTRRISLVGGIVDSFNEVSYINFNCTYGKQKAFYMSVNTNAGTTLTYYAQINSFDYDQYVGVCGANCILNDVVSVSQIGNIFENTGFIVGKPYYLGQQSSIVSASSSTINGTSYTNSFLGVATSDSSLLLKI